MSGVRELADIAKDIAGHVVARAELVARHARLCEELRTTCAKLRDADVAVEQLQTEAWQWTRMQLGTAQAPQVSSEDEAFSTRTLWGRR